MQQPCGFCASEAGRCFTPGLRRYVAPPDNRFDAATQYTHLQAYGVEAASWLSSGEAGECWENGLFQYSPDQGLKEAPDQFPEPRLENRIRRNPRHTRSARNK